MNRTSQIISVSLLAALLSVSTAQCGNKQSDVAFPFEKAKKYVGSDCEGNTPKTILGYTEIYDGTVKVFYKCGNDMSSDAFILVTTENGREWIYYENKPNAGIVR